MNRKQKIIVSITGIFIVLLALVGLTYAYFLTRINGNEEPKSISVTTANLQLVYGGDDGSVIGENEVIEPGKTFDAKTFTVTNNGNAVTDYVVVIEILEGTSTFKSNDFTYTLTCTSGCNGVDTSSIFPIDGGILVGNSIDVGETQTYSFTLTYEETGIDQSDDMNKTLNARININDVKQMENPFSTGVAEDDNVSLAYNIINNAKDNKNGTTFVNTPLTRIAESISQYATEVSYETVSTSDLCAEYYTFRVGDTPSAAQSGGMVDSYEEAVGKYVYDNCNEWTKYLDSYDSSTSTLSFKSETMADESTLSMTNDDLGTSYYYRGAVEDNYVTFAGMCWRIVRIDGNGNTKLILEDQDEVCSTTMNGNWDIEASDGTNITTDGTNPYRTGNFGYVTSGKTKMSYLNPVNNPNRAMVNAFKYFQTNTLSNKITNTYNAKKLSDYLVSGNWCLGDKAYTRSGSSGSYTYTLLEDTSNNYSSTTDFYYDSSVRLTSGNANGYQPTLKCPVETMETFGDNTTPMYVGTLTADEIVYAGGIVGSNNPNYYLINKWQNSNSKIFWSLSPGSFSGDGEFAFSVSNDGSLGSKYVDFDCSFRPSVSLKSGITMTTNPDIATYGEPGTIGNAYVIE